MIARDCQKRFTYFNGNTSKNILVIEDSSTVRGLLEEILSELGYVVVTAESIATAKKALNTVAFDLVIIELMLPDGNGNEIHKIIKREYPSTKIVVLTTKNDELQRYKLFQDGILDYFIKDANIENSVYHIHELLKQLEYNRQFSILIVDDSKLARKALMMFLEPRDYQLLEAESAKEGMELIETKNVDVVLLDMNLSGESGLEMLESIKTSQHASIPVIVVTGSSDPEIMRQAYKLGAKDMLQKPVVAEEMLHKVTQSIKEYVSTLELDCSMQLLREYKNVIDNSTIVSKTNEKGVITYVNQAFCDISGYSKDELIGKPHNIVRHPDMPTEAFKELWETLKEKKSWKGVIKNRKKDGTHYWVDSYVTPIFDYFGNVVEYIGMRHDITPMQDMKEELDKNLNITSENFAEAYKKAQEYEHAIDESNILSRTDLKGVITYANKAFVEVSGYSEDELIGKTHAIIRHPDTPDTLFKEIWQTLAKGKVWKGLIKNRRKDGSSYWVNSIILPIKNSKGKNVEYMSIRNDVTEIILLHSEIENTQKELIFRMGELAESRSKETGNHIKRVAAYSEVLARAYGLDEKEVELLKMASPMHDIGKLSTPDAILKKPGALSDEEWVIMKEHAAVGHSLLFSSDKPILKAAAIIAHEHHEKYNGKGYPQGLKGDDIHIYGRITAIADVFDALGSDRCYKKAWDDERIFKLFEEERGEHFDPALIDLFFKHKDEILAIRECYKDVDGSVA